MNFVSNAIKFTQQGGVLVRIAAEPTAGGLALYRLAVEDTGIGIAEDKRELIFEEFSQADATTARLYGGTGLGLAICQRLAALMQGGIGLDSTEGEGACFWLEVELPVVTPARYLPKLADEHDAAPLVWLFGDRLQPSLTQRWCQRWGVAVQCFEVPPSRHSAHPRIAIVDDVWGREHCMTVAEAIGQRFPGSRLLLLSVHSWSETELLTAGFHAWLQRPLREELLHAMLQQLLREAPEKPLTRLSFNAEVVSAPLARSLSQRVLLVEDNPINQRVTRRMLELSGALVTLAANGYEAVEMCQGQSFDLVLMDCHMPELDGFAATRELRRIEAEQGRARMPILALTASAMESERQACYASGMDEVLTKPIKLGVLEAALTRWASAAEV